MSHSFTHLSELPTRSDTQLCHQSANFKLCARTPDPTSCLKAAPDPSKRFGNTLKLPLTSIGDNELHQAICVAVERVLRLQRSQGYFEGL